MDEKPKKALDHSADEDRDWANRILEAERREILNYGTPGERQQIHRREQREQDLIHHRERLWRRNFGRGEEVDVDLQLAIELSTLEGVREGAFRV